ncbi:MAG: EAL domain-containing protein, partial [Halanaerobiales bacterium]
MTCLNIMKESLEIDEIITYFQPIISIEKKQIIGYECLARGISNKEIISPIELLDYAYKKGFTISLDRSFREKAIQTISKINTANFNNLFFINIDVSILDKVIGSNHIINNIKKNKIDPESIVLEINESKIEKTKDLITFVEKYKEYGFIIALDDV